MLFHLLELKTCGKISLKLKKAYRWLIEGGFQLGILPKENYTTVYKQKLSA